MQPSRKNVVSVKDKLDGNEIDLSMMELTEVPVKELVIIIAYASRKFIETSFVIYFVFLQAAVTRGTVLDLSNNQLVTLPVSLYSFACTLSLFCINIYL